MSEAYERAACGLLTTSAHGLIEHANHTLCVWLGYSAEELKGRKLQDLLTMGSKLFHHTQWMPLLQLQGSIAEVQLELVTRDGRVLPALFNAARRGGTGVLVEPVDVAIFIASDRRKYERELLEARKRAEQLLESERAAQEEVRRAAEQRAVTAEELIGIVSHDLRNPLNVVLLGTHMLESAPQDAQPRVVHRIAAAAERANKLIGDLLDFTQARLGGGLRVSKVPVDLHAVVAECLEETKLAWPGRMIEHRRQGDASCAADPDRLAQVVSNLVNNAFVYGTPSTPVGVSTIGTERSVELRVHNTGTPIPAEMVEQIFEPLRRGEQQVSLGSRSVGLGLYIVRQIAHAHGGEVTVRSSAEEGTTFALTLPRPSA